MSYAPWALKAKSGYSAIFHTIKDINPKGTCFALSSLWLQVLLGAKNTGPQEMMKMLDQNTAGVAPFHATHHKQLDVATTSTERGKVIASTIEQFGLVSNTLPNDLIGVSRQPAPGERKEWANADWGTCNKGDIWCVVGNFMLQTRGAFLLEQYEGNVGKTEGHALAAFVEGDAIRIYDMNSGEFRVVGPKQFDTWAAGHHHYYDYKVNFLDVIPVTLK